MFNIDIPSWLIPNLVQGFFIVVGFILGAILTLILQRRQWAKEQAHKDMEIIYEPLFEEINKLLEVEELLRESPTSPYLSYIAPYKKLDYSGKVNLKIHDELRRDMDDLLDKINNEDKAFNMLLDKLRPLCERIEKSIPVIMQDGEIRSIYDWGILRIEKYGIIYGNREEWGTNFENKIKEFEDRSDGNRVDLKVTGNELFDQLFSQIRNERKDAFSKKDEIFTKAKEIEKKLDYKTRHQKKRYGKQLKNQGEF